MGKFPSSCYELIYFFITYFFYRLGKIVVVPLYPIRNILGINLFPNQKIIKDKKALISEVDQLKEYFSGDRKKFDIELEVNMPPFYQKVINVVNKIPYGKYLSYEQVATKAGNPKAARAAGTANAMNTIPIIIPCHRVLAKHGKLGGYGGGIKIKKYLLKLEGIQ